MRDPRVDEFQALFNRGEFWESHEVLEGLWHEVHGPRRDLYQGLIQIAASLVHWQRHNSHGMRKLSGRAKCRLAAFGPVEDGLALRDLLLEWERCLFFGGPAPVLHNAEPSDRSAA